MTELRCTCDRVLGADPECTVHGARSIYIAASSQEVDRVQKAIVLVGELGGRLAHDWLALEDTGPIRLKDHERATRMLDRLRAAGSCHALVLLVPDEDEGAIARRAWIEAGTAFAHGRPVFASSVSATLPDAVVWANHVRTDRDAIAAAVRGGVVRNAFLPSRHAPRPYQRRPR